MFINATIGLAIILVTASGALAAIDAAKAQHHPRDSSSVAAPTFDELYSSRNSGRSVFFLPGKRRSINNRKTPPLEIPGLGEGTESLKTSASKADEERRQGSVAANGCTGYVYSAPAKFLILNSTKLGWRCRHSKTTANMSALTYIARLRQHNAGARSIHE
jgi:hypothetical protein